MHDFVWRTSPEDLAFPSMCACGNDALPLLDTFYDYIGPTGEGRLYLCVGCNAKILAENDVVRADDYGKVVKQLNDAVKERTIFQSNIHDFSVAGAAKDAELARLSDEVVTLRSSEASATEAMMRMQAEARERRKNGGKTLAEIKAEIAGAAA